MELPKTKHDLITEVSSGRHFNYVFFWGHSMKADESIDKSCFSQWYASGFEAHGLFFRTAEHYMMHGKAKLFGDEGIASRILASDTPKDAKELGRRVKGFDPRTWDEKKEEIVFFGNLNKFAQNPDLQSFLLSTGTSVLVEAAPNDAIWGIGIAESDRRCRIPSQWPGDNLLGFCLMKVRESLMGT